jgi:homoserine acetyltransferase
MLVAAQAAPYPEPVHGDFVIRDFRFAGGEVLLELKLHYFTLGNPARDTNGRVTNAVLLLHGTGGKGTQRNSAKTSMQRAQRSRRKTEGTAISGRETGRSGDACAKLPA